MTSSNQPSQRRSALYSFAWWLFKLLSPLLFPVRYHNKEHLVQAQAPFILVSNHTSMLDPLVLAIASKRYHIHFLGKTELNAGGFLSLIFKNLHMISVSRHATDMAAIRACNEVLKSGNVLGLFPEGTRNKPENFLQGVESGLGMIALRNRVPVIPAYIHERVRFFRRTHVYFLPPIPYEDLISQGMGKDTVEAMTKRFIDTLQQAKQTAQTELSKS